MTTYTVSWEEYLEIYQDHLPQPSVGSFVSCVVIGIAVGVFGALLTYNVDPGGKLIASVFLWLSFPIFVGAFWDLKYRTNKRKLRAIKGLQTVYRKYHSSQHAFAFDQSKWTYEDDASKHEVPWTALQSAAERQHVIELSAKGAYTVVPKRSFGEKELDELRLIALPYTRSGWAFRVGFLDFVLTEVPTLWRNHPFLMAEGHAAGFVFSGLIASMAYEQTGRVAVWGWLLAASIFFLTVTTQFWYFLIKYQTSHKQLREASEVEFSDRGLFTHTAKWDSFIAWANFRGFRETGRCFLLNINETRYYLYSKRGLSSDQRASLRQLFKSKLAEE